MENEKCDVFISYSRKDYVDENENVIPGNEVSKIMKALTDAGISYWIDKEGIYSGDKFTELLPTIIKSASVFVYLSTANANKSKYTSKEIAIADEYGKHIIPVRIDMTPYSDKVIFRIADISFIKYEANPEKGRQELIRSIKAYLDKLEKLKQLEEEFKLKKLREEEEKKRKLEEERKKEEIRKEIKVHVEDCQRLIVQQESIVKQLINKNYYVGNDTKTCPICNNSTPLNKTFCEKCGWQFPLLYSLDGNNTFLCDELQLSVARTNWQSLSRIVDLQNESQKLESIRKELEDTKKDYEKKMCYQEKSIEDLSNQCQKQKEHINEKEEELASLQKSISSLSMQLDLSKQEVSQKEEQVQNNQNIILSLKERIESLTKDISQYKQNIQKKEEQIEKQIKEYKLLEDKYYQLIKGTTTTTIPKDTNIDQKTSSTAKEATVQNATPTLKKSIKSLDEAFSIIETCCNTSPIQDNYDLNRAKLSINWMINILGKKYGLYVSKNAILACKNIGELKHLLYNSSNRNGNQ